MIPLHYTSDHDFAAEEAEAQERWLEDLREKVLEAEELDRLDDLTVEYPETEVRMG